MANLIVMLALAFSFLSSSLAADAQLQNCGNGVSNFSRSLGLTINSKKNEMGDWVTTFSAVKDSSHSANNILLDVNHNLVECNGKHLIHIQGVVNVTQENQDSRKLQFHPKCGKNAAISNDGRTAQKMNLDDGLNGVLLTNRPLNKNELFEVKLVKKHTKFSHCFGMGITIYSPTSRDIPDHMWHLKSGNWMYYHSHIYLNGADLLKNYGKNLNELQVGDRVGVLVNNFDTLHFFVNGVDQGPAASNIPTPIYGVFELYYNAAKGTIVDTSSTTSK